MPLDSERRKKLFRLVPEGALVTRKYLQANDLSNHSIDNFLKSQQLVTVKNGLYKREGTIVEWEDVVYFLQNGFDTDLVIGGVTALEIQKLSHYLSLSNRRPIHLYGSDNLPVWINRISDGATFYKHNLGDLVGQEINDDSKHELLHFTKTFSWKNTEEGLKMSTPERAILEVLNEVPYGVSFEHADELMQGLNTLSPRALQKLLERCNNFKIRRLFFFFSEKYNYSYLSKLNKENINFGAGNRVIVKGGKLNKKYEITVPLNYD